MNSNKRETNTINHNSYDDIKKLSQKLEKEDLFLENMKIKKEETENEIEKLKIE
jgi:hypothetical protein